MTKINIKQVPLKGLGLWGIYTLPWTHLLRLSYSPTAGGSRPVMNPVSCLLEASLRSLVSVPALPLSERTRNSANQSLVKKLRSSDLGLVELLIVSLAPALRFRGFISVSIPSFGDEMWYPAVFGVLRGAQAPPGHQRLDLLTAGKGRGLCLGGAGIGEETTRKEANDGTDRKEAAKPLHLEVLPTMDPSLEGEKLSSAPGTAWLRAPALPSPAASTQTVPVLRRLQLLKLKLKTAGTWGPLRSPTLIPDLPFPLLQEGEGRSTQPKYQRETGSLGLTCTATGIYILIASWLQKALMESTFAKTM